MYKYCPLNIFWPLCLKIAKLRLEEATWEWMFPIMWRSYKWSFSKNCRLFCHQTKQIGLSIASYLLGHKFEISLHICHPFEFYTWGHLCFSNISCFDSIESPIAKTNKWHWFIIRLIESLCWSIAMGWRPSMCIITSSPLELQGPMLPNFLCSTYSVRRQNC